MEINLENTIQILSQVVERQIPIYTEILQIAKEQENTIKENNEIKLMELIEAKANLMNKANTLSQNADSFRQYWDQHLEEVSFEIRNKMREKVSVLSDLIKKVIEAEANTRVLLEDMQEEKNKKNQQKNNLKKLKSAYGAGPIKDQFIDRDN